MCNLTEILKKIGLSYKEASIYIATLKVGSNPASIIAKYSEVNRCTTYSILESLEKKGLVSEFERRKIKYFTALPPEQLPSYIDEKRRDLAFYRNEITTLMPHFQAIQHKDQVRPFIKSYWGRVGLSQIYHSIVQEECLSVWGIYSKDNYEFFSRFAANYLNDRKTFKIIKYSKNSAEKYEINCTDDLKKIKSIKPVEFITDKKIVLASGAEPYFIEIKNPEIVKYFKNKFDLCWHNKKAPS